MDIIIIGSGVAGVSFAEKYRLLDTSSAITLITQETDGYYSRPLLSRGFSKSDIEQSIILKTFGQLRSANIDVISGAEITALIRSDKTVAYTALGDAQTLRYDKLILATGSSAFIPPSFMPYNELVFSLNSLDDLKALRRFRLGVLNQNRQVQWAIIGGGLIGCEVASDLAVSGDKVTLYHAMDSLMERQLVPEDSALLLDVLQKSGVQVLFNQAVQGLSKTANKVSVQTNVATEFDALIVACGFKPRVGLAQSAGLEIGRGIKVNPFLQTSDDSIYALGDVAELPNGKLYAFILPIRSQAHWLANFIAGTEQQPWAAPEFKAKAKVHGFEAVYPYRV